MAETDQWQYIAMKLIEGGTLAHEIHKNGVGPYLLRAKMTEIDELLQDLQRPIDGRSGFPPPAVTLDAGRARCPCLSAPCWPPILHADMLT